MLRFGEIWVLFPFWGLLDHESGNRQQTEDITTKHIVSRRQEQTTFCDSKSFESSLVICSVLFCSVSICETQSSFLGDKLKQGKKKPHNAWVAHILGRAHADLETHAMRRSF